MDDYEINRRLAEIAGLTVSDEGDVWGDGAVGCADPEGLNPGSCAYRFRPLTDWSQLGPLMERYGVGTERMDPEHAWHVWASREGSLRVTGEVIQSGLKRAICLAIIAAHEAD